MCVHWGGHFSSEGLKFFIIMHGFWSETRVFFLKYDLNHWLNTDFWVENLSEFELSGSEPGNLHKSSYVLLIIMPFIP